MNPAAYATKYSANQPFPAPAPAQRRSAGLSTPNPHEYVAEAIVPDLNLYPPADQEPYLEARRRSMAQDIALAVLDAGDFDVELTEDTQMRTHRLRLTLRIEPPSEAKPIMGPVQTRVRALLAQRPGYAPPPLPGLTMDQVLTMLDAVEADLLPGTDAGFVVALLRDRIAELTEGKQS